MKTKMTTVGTTALSLGAAFCLSLGGVSAAWAQSDPDQSGIEILEPESASCPTRGGLCFSPGAAATAAAPSAPAVSAAVHPAASAAPRFQRLALAGRSVDDAVPWTISVSGNLRQPALNGNALFLVFDAENPRAILDHEVIAMWQARVRAGSQVSARLTLSPDDGFHAGHTYHVRVSQIINHKEVVLADGEVRLQ